MAQRPNLLLFRVWFGIFVPPITIGVMILAFGHHWLLGLITVAICAGWIVETGRTTCRRCWAYGTLGCGLPSLSAPLFGSRLPASTLTPFRIRVHAWVDLGGAAFLNLMYLWLAPLLAPLVLFWTIVAWFLVMRPQRFHGLLPLLRNEEAPETHRRIGLPLVELNPPQTGCCP